MHSFGSFYVIIFRSVVVFAVVCYADVDRVVITVPNNFLNLAEVQLFDQGRQISPNSLIFTLSSFYPGVPASNCNDGIIPTSWSDPVNVCHSQWGPSNLTIQISGDMSANQIVIWNRVDCCQDRINGATVATYVGGAMVWSTIVPSTSAMMYSFVVGKMGGLLSGKMGECVIRRMVERVCDYLTI